MRRNDTRNAGVASKTLFFLFKTNTSEYDTLWCCICIFGLVNFFPRYVCLHNPTASPGYTVIERLYVTGTMQCCAYRVRTYSHNIYRFTCSTYNKYADDDDDDDVATHATASAAQTDGSEAL